MAGYSHRTAQPLILATFLSWGGSAGAGRVRPAGANVGQMRGLKKTKTGQLPYDFGQLKAPFSTNFAWN